MGCTAVNMCTMRKCTAVYMCTVSMCTAGKKLVWIADDVSGEVLILRSVPPTEVS